MGASPLSTRRHSCKRQLYATRALRKMVKTIIMTEGWGGIGGGGGGLLLLRSWGYFYIKGENAGINIEGDEVGGREE